MTDTDTTDIAKRRDAVLAELSAASETPPTLVAVTKTQPDEAIDAILATGQRVFGENRVQEAKARWADRRSDWPDLELHLIGPLQTNKADEAVALFDMIETVDRPKLVHALAKAMEKAGRRLPVLIQVNTGEEPQKAGIAPQDLPSLLQEAREAGLDVRGLMCIPPADEPAGPHFALLAKLAREAGLSVLSMGMSGDYVTAARFGSTHVRVGTALFGARS
ncbi:MAG: YggS family pyridoxal phosphate-dependent enzyme [Hyphomonas sp.]|nr:YggS family pyridoxal phosphate-dependent enzyme [Hyphomonas sp.]